MNIRNTFLATLALTASALASIAPAAAQKADTDVTARLFALFKEACYDTMPEVKLVESAAALNNWKPVTGLALQAFAPQVTSKFLKGWRIEDKTAPATVVVAVSKVDAEIAKVLPEEFKSADAHSCSLLPGRNPDHDAIAASFKAMLGRDHEDSFEEGRLRVNLWSGVTDEIVVMLYHYRPKSGSGGGLLNFTAIPK